MQAPCCPPGRPIPASPRQWAGCSSRRCRGPPAGSPWRDASGSFGRESRLQGPPTPDTSGIFETVAGEPPDEFDLEYVSAGGTIGQAHQKAAGAREGSRQGIGGPGGGLTGRTVAVTAAPGCLVCFVILPGQAHVLAGVPELMEDLSFGDLIGDGAFDANWLLEEIEESGAMAVIPPRRRQVVPGDHDRWGGRPPNGVALRQGKRRTGCA